MATPPPPPNPWSDRRGLFQRGKEVHEPARRPSQGDASGVIETVRRASVNSVEAVEKALGSGPTSPVSQRRRSSAASSGLFGNLSNMKRGSEDYGERRASYSAQMSQGGMVSGWWNSTFRGMQKPKPDEDASSNQQQK